MNTRTKQFTLITLILLFALGAASCSAGDGQATPTPVDQADDVFNPVVSATGVVVPVQWATLSIGTNGEIVELPVEIGDEVSEGDLLAALDTRPTLRAAVTAARVELVSAENALDELRENEALDRANARQDLADAREELKDAQYLRRVRQKGNRASEDDIDAAEARLALAEDAVDVAKSVYDRFSGRDEDDPARADARHDLALARQDRDAAERAINWLKGSPTEIEQAQLDADVAVAEAEVAEAERRLQRLEEGPDNRELEAAIARVDNARAQLEAAEAALADAEIRAPFDGTIGEVLVQNHTWVTAGTPIVTMGDLTELRIETTDLNEIDAARVQPGDEVTITIDALPEFEGRGTIRRLAPKASAGTGVNYTAVIDVEELPAGVRWGMTAFVDIEVTQ